MNKWDLIESEYMRDLGSSPITLSDIAKKYCVPYGTITKRAANGKWREKRKQSREIYKSMFREKILKEFIENSSLEAGMKLIKALKDEDNKIFIELTDEGKELYKGIE